MMTYVKKYFSRVVLLVVIFVSVFGGLSHVFAQSASLGSITDYRSKTPVESPWNGIPATIFPTSSQIANSSCPEGSVLVGFNLYNMGRTYDPYGSLYCKTITFAQSAFDYSLSQPNNISREQGRSGSTSITKTLALGSTSQPVSFIVS